MDNRRNSNACYVRTDIIVDDNSSGAIEIVFVGVVLLIE